MPVGILISLWRYPVKSMQGEELEASAITERGVLGDRAYAIIERETGIVASAKHPRKWERLFACRAEYASPPEPGAPPPPLWITLPNGERIRSERPDIDVVLSQVLGREVNLVTEAPEKPMREANRTPLDAAPGDEVIRREDLALAAPAGGFFDYAPLHVLTTATLAQFQEIYPEGQFDARRFRPNFLIDTSGFSGGFAENEWLGKSASLGVDVRMKLIDPCPRCIVTTLPQQDLPRDTGILRTVAQHNSAASATLAPGVLFPAVAGAYAQVLQEGVAHCGDTMKV